MVERECESKILAIIGALTNELGRHHLANVRLDASIRDDLGIDSLGRIELMVRLQQELHVTLTQQQVLDADTPRKLIELIELIDTSQDVGPDVPHLPDSEFSLATRTVGDQRVDLPVNAETLLEVLQRHAEITPSRTHLTLVKDGKSRHLTYGELLRKSELAARNLRARGIASGHQVGLLLSTCEEYFATFFGLLLAGAVPVPLDPSSYSEKRADRHTRLQAILRNANSVALITGAEAREHDGVLESHERIIAVNELFKDDIEFKPLPASATGEDVALIQYTSGSTNDPKGVMLKHNAILANIRSIGRVLEIDANDVAVSWLPLCHDMGLIGAWLASLFHGCRLVLLPTQAFVAQPESWLWAIHHYRGTLSTAPNFAYEICARRIDDDAIAGLDLSTWRIALNGAETVIPDTIERFTHRYASHGFRPEALSPVYGLAENCVAVTLPRLAAPARIDTIDRSVLQRNQEARSVADDSTSALKVVGCGHAIPDHGVRIVNAVGVPMEERREGRIQVCGPSTTCGYYRNPEANEQLFDGDWIETGDIGYIANGELFVTGRSTDVVIRAGRKIHPNELEREIGDIENIRSDGVALLGISDKARGTERLIIVAETRARRREARKGIVTRIQTTTSRILDSFPDDILLVRPGTIPKTSSGKIRRAECRQRYLADRLHGSRHAQSRLAKLWDTCAKRFRGGRTMLGEWSFAAYGLGLIFLSKSVSGCSILLIPHLKYRRRFVAVVCRLFLSLAGIRISISGMEHLTNEPCVVIANHQGMLCGIVMHAILPESFFFTPKREFKESRLADLFLSRLGVQYVDKHDPNTGLADLESVKRRLVAGESAMVFPEGVFYREPGLHQFFMGGFMTAAATSIPIVPVAICGARDIWRGRTWRPFLRRGSVAVKVMPPISPRGNGWQAAVALCTESRAQILPHTGEFDALAGR